MVSVCPEDEMKHRLLNVFVLSYLKAMEIVDPRDLENIPCDFLEYISYKNECACSVSYNPITSGAKLKRQIQNSRN